MIIVIAGKIGSGKSTLSKILENAGFNVVHTDNLVREFYKTKTGINYIDNLFSDVVENEVINTQKLTDCLLKDYVKKRTLESYMAMTLVLPIIKKHQEENTTVYIDGILPDYFKWFDQIIFIDRKLEDRKKDVIKKRGMNVESFNMIERLQERYPKFL